MTTSLVTSWELCTVQWRRKYDAVDEGHQQNDLDFMISRSPSFSPHCRCMSRKSIGLAHLSDRRDSFIVYITVY
jgi:hypothetical protein